MPEGVNAADILVSQVFEFIVPEKSSPISIIARSSRCEGYPFQLSLPLSPEKRSRRILLKPKVSLIDFNNAASGEIIRAIALKLAGVSPERNS